MRGDLFQKLVETEESADFCICVGTSLSGMNADRIPVSTAKRFVKKRKGLGTVMINLQRTHLDASCSLRIWGKADQVFSMLAKEMAIPTERIPLPLPCVRTLCPYDETGNRALNGRLMVIDIEPEQRIEVGQRTDNSSRHRFGRVERIDEKGHAYVILEGAKGKLARPAVLGSWWMQAAALGTVDVIPLRNEKPVFLEQNDALCSVEFNCRAISEKNWEWSLECSSSCPLRIKQVTYKLHPTFTPSVVVMEGNANKLVRTGWGTFVVPIEITFEDSSKVNVEYQLDFTHAKNVQIVQVSERRF